MHMDAAMPCKKKTRSSSSTQATVARDAAMPSKKKTNSASSSQETVARITASNEVPQTKNACMVESHESTRKRVEPSLPQNHEDHIAGNGFNSMNHCNMDTSLFLCHRLRRSHMRRQQWIRMEQAENNFSVVAE